MATLTSPVLQTLLTAVRSNLNQPDPNNSFWRDDELTMYLNDAILRYFQECVLNNEGYFTTQTDLNIVANQETVPLPTDCFTVKNLWKKVTNGYIILNYRNTVTDSYNTQGGTSSESYLPWYYFQGSNLVLRNTPNFSETAGLRLEYIQFPTTMIYGGDTLTNQVSPVFKELIIMYAVFKAKLKESLVNGGSMHVPAAQQVQALYQSFKDVIQNRSKNPTFVIPFNPESDSF